MTQITIPAQVVNGHLQHEKSLAELEGQHVLATLTVVTPNGTEQVPVVPVDWQKLQDKIASLNALKDGWDSYCAPAPSPDSIAQATVFLDEVAKAENAPSRLAPSVVGGVGFTFKRGGRKAYVEFRNTGSVHALFSDGVGEPVVEKVEKDRAGYANLIAKTKKYLDE